MLSSQKKVVLKVEEIEEVNEWLGCLKDLNF